MSKTKMDNNFLLGFSARQRSVLYCLARGKSISETSRKLGVSRGAIYAWLNDPEFKKAVGIAQFNLAIADEIAERCFAYRQAVLRTIIKLLGKLPESEGRRILSKFETKLDKIDQQAGIGANT